MLTRRKTVETGVPAAGGAYGSLGIRNGTYLGGQTSPNALFDSLFAELALTLEEQAAGRARKLSALDGAGRDFERIARKVSGEDRRRIEAHLDSLRSVELRLGAFVECDPSLIDQSQLAAAESGDNGLRWRMNNDLLALALACDVTRVATSSYDHGGGGFQPFPWLGVEEDWHELSHQVVGADPTAVERFRTIKQWFATELAHFVQTLKDTSTPEGTLFDDTVILEGSELSFDHGQTDLNLLILAGEKTGLRRGQYVVYPERQPHNRLLTTLGHAFGLEVDGFGDPAFPGDLDDTLLA